MANTAPADRNAPTAWIVATMAVVAAWAAFSTFKSGPAEWTVVVPLFAPGAVFVPVAVEIRRRFGAACDLPIAIVVLLGMTVVMFAMIVVMLVLSLPRIG